MTQTPGARGRGDEARSFLLGPGQRLGAILRVLAGLGGQAERLADVAGLARRSPAEDVELVLDADSTDLLDLGYVRRFLASDGTARATVTGDDPGTRVARTLLALPRTRWMSWPPVLDDLVALSGLDVRDATSSAPDERRDPGATQRTPSSSPPRATVHARAQPDADDEATDELDRIEAILAGQSLLEDREAQPARRPGARTQPRSDAVAPGSAADFEPLEDEEIADDPGAAFDARVPAGAPEPGVEPRPGDAPPPWWRAQVADLADAAQRVELGVQALRLCEPDEAEEVREHVDLLDAEVARLVQFARTLGYVASPPARGEQVFDLADTVQMFVAQLASRPERAPRCQFRSAEPVYVRSDRALLGQAFDAFFWLAGACAGAGDLVRAQVLHDGGPAEVRLEFPAGPLAGVETARILEPYGLRRILPDLGPNALSAATAIVVGQGGRAELSRFSSGRLGWRITLPVVDAPQRKSK